MENKGKKVSLQLFEETARNNGYEVFTPEEVAAYYKEGLMKSMVGQMDSANKEEFVSDIMHLQKAVVIDENGKETVRYYRKAQVKWEETANGIILKGLEGVYTDTPENRRLNRVGEAYVAEENVLKSILDNDEDILKAVRTGRYADTPENRRLHRVGQPYKAREKKAGDEAKGEKKKTSNKNSSEDYTDKNIQKDIISSFKKVYPASSYNYLNKVYNYYKKSGMSVEEYTSLANGELKDNEISKMKEYFKSRDKGGEIKEDTDEYEESERKRKKEFGEFMDSHKDFVSVGGGNYAKINKVKPNGDLEVTYARKGEKDWNDVIKKGSEDYKELEAYGKIPKDEKSDKGKVDKEDKKPEQKPENKDTSKSGDNEESYTRVKFDDLPNSGKVNLKKKYLTPKRKAAADNKLSDISKMDTSELKKMEKGLVNDLNKNFEAIKKSQRAELLYSIMKVKGELEKRGKESQKKE